MVGSGLRKLGNECGLQVVSGSVCGNFKGYFIRMNDGAGIKEMNLCYFTEESEKKIKINSFIEENKKNYRINFFTETPTGISFVFADTFSTISIMKDFLDVFVSYLNSLEIKGADFCSVCGKSLDAPPEFQFRGNITYYGHRSCMQNDPYNDFDAVTESNKSYGKGIVGALLGMIVGAIPMIILSQMGWYAGIAGFILGFVIKKGYEILGGKLGNLKLPIIILFACLGVLFVTFCDCAIATYGFWMEENLVPTFFELIDSTFSVMFDPENTTFLMQELGLGFLFTALGCYSVLKKINNEIRAQDSRAKIHQI